MEFLIGGVGVFVGAVLTYLGVRHQVRGTKQVATIQTQSADDHFITEKFQELSNEFERRWNESDSKWRDCEHHREEDRQAMGVMRDQNEALEIRLTDAEDRLQRAGESMSNGKSNGDAH